MHQATWKHAGFFLLIGTLWAATPLLAAAPATAEFVWGTAHILSATGEKIDLKKGSPVQVGDTVVSGNGRVQLRFSDGGFVSLVPYSEFRVNAYSYGMQEGLERVAMELLKGGLRTISGLIGKKNRSAYEMKTTVATIGIRGTEYTVVYGESVSGTVSAGAIAVCNAGGCLDVPFGQSYYVRDGSTKPVFISKAVQLPPPQTVVAEADKEVGQAPVKDQAAEVESNNARSSRKAERDNSPGPEKHLKPEQAHEVKGGRGNDGLATVDGGKGPEKPGKGWDNFKPISAADFGNAQLTAMPTPGKSPGNSSIAMDFEVSPGIANIKNGGPGKGNGNLLSAVDGLSILSEVIPGGPAGKDKKPKK